MKITKTLLKSYRSNRRMVRQLTKDIDSLNERLNNLNVIAGKVSKSSDDYPYIEEHITVEMEDPRAAEPIRRKIVDRKKRRKRIQKDVQAVESYIRNIDDDMERQIFEWLYIDGMSQEEIGELVGYSQGRISQIIRDRLKEDE